MPSKVFLQSKEKLNSGTQLSQNKLFFVSLGFSFIALPDGTDHAPSWSLMLQHKLGDVNSGMHQTLRLTVNISDYLSKLKLYH